MFKIIFFFIYFTYKWILNSNSGVFLFYWAGSDFFTYLLFNIVNLLEDVFVFTFVVISEIIFNITVYKIDFFAILIARIGIFSKLLQFLISQTNSFVVQNFLRLIHKLIFVLLDLFIIELLVLYESVKLMVDVSLYIA